MYRANKFSLQDRGGSVRWLTSKISSMAFSTLARSCPHYLFVDFSFCSLFEFLLNYLVSAYQECIAFYFCLFLGRPGWVLFKGHTRTSKLQKKPHRFLSVCVLFRFIYYCHEKACQSTHVGSITLRSYFFFLNKFYTITKLTSTSF